jgi:CRISPR-associated protein Cas8c/Csd1, subtype I-C/DVULG
MSILKSLVDLYDRMDGVPSFGYSPEGVSFLISLKNDGMVSELIDLREGEGKTARSRSMMVPQAVKRTSGVLPNFLWDKTSYVLGLSADYVPKKDEPEEVTARAVEKIRKAEAAQHKAFVDFHMGVLAETDDEGLIALRAFLSSWEPARFNDLNWPTDVKGSNVAFLLESDKSLIHERAEAKLIWSRISRDDDAELAPCLVTGEVAPVARLHPSIKNVSGAKSTGASLVSFNRNAYDSYGKSQGWNAQVSERAAFAYGAALNHMLQYLSGHRINIGDTTSVFWADASKREMASEMEALFAMMFDAGDADKSVEAVSNERLKDRLEQIRRGAILKEIDPNLDEGVRFHVLGLSPNAARISIRFHYCDTFGSLAANYQKFVSEMHISPPPKDGLPPLWRYLCETAVLRKAENIIPALSGEWMRSILTGDRYPLSLMSTVLLRIRADRDINALRASILRAVLIRNFGKDDTPVALDRNHTGKGYLLGRLFATYERVQSAALGSNVNATVKDKFYSAASAQPRRVFGALESGSAKHLTKLGKTKRGYRIVLEKEIASIMDMMSPGEDPYPASLSTEEQALFALGYYHQRNDFFNSTENKAVPAGE